MQPTNSASDEKPSLFASFISRIHEDWLTEKRCKLEIKSKDIFSDDFDTTFSNEIRALMYAYGDVRDPNWISVLTMTKHLRNYINTLLIDANKIANMRGDKLLEHQSILFLFRKNKEKLQRLLTYMKIKDYKSTLVKKSFEYNPEISEEGPRVKDCAQFLGEILPPEEVNEIRDQKVINLGSQRRLQRNDYRTQNMSNEEYMEFVERQQCSFLKNGLASFGNWLMQDYVTSLEPTTLSLEIMNFLVRDYIAEVIDEVLLQRDGKRGPLYFSSSSPRHFQSKSPSPSQASPSSRLSSLTERPISKPSDSRRSRISAIVNIYNDSPQALLRSNEDDATILPEEIDSAVDELKAIYSPFTLKERFRTARKETAETNLEPSDETTDRTLTTSNITLQGHEYQALTGGSCKPEFLSTSKTKSKKVDAGGDVTS
ncbi:transcription initiation protein SPT3 homolog isoform X2 [Uloborus diversus]|uniref:transcription initiation protein SPT3 homolog isoform X2 n=1 Tax=Uloborus diversus TaxID=327109 RepID=UPI00240A09FB|nr:transcription initiation protein SPT3 homolog isoform X2 [Uloborus diversus]